MMNMVRPRCLGASQSVRARHIAWVADIAAVLQILEPFITHSSPSRSARVRHPARSDPPVGSERNCTHWCSPLSIGGRYFAFCSSVPKSTSVAPRMLKCGTLRCSGIS